MIKIQKKRDTEFHAVGSSMIFSHNVKWKALVNVFQMLKVNCSFTHVLLKQSISSF